MTGSFIHPALIMIIGALLVPFIRGPLRKPYLILIPLLTLGAVISNNSLNGSLATFQFMDWQLVFGRVDKLSSVFATIMALMALIGTLYGMHVEKTSEHIADWFYVAGALGTIYAGGVGEFGYITPDKFGELIYISLSENLDTTYQQFQNVWKTYTADNAVYFCTPGIIFKYDVESLFVSL